MTPPAPAPFPGHPRPGTPRDPLPVPAGPHGVDDTAGPVIADHLTRTPAPEPAVTLVDQAVGLFVGSQGQRALRPVASRGTHIPCWS